jgi:hypothetical protein
MDFELWGEFLYSGMDIKYIDVDIGKFRIYSGQKVSQVLHAAPAKLEAVQRLVERHPKWDRKKKELLIEKAEALEEQAWKNSGRLAKLGLPRQWVRNLRKIKRLLSLTP